MPRALNFVKAFAVKDQPTDPLATFARIALDAVQHRELTFTTCWQQTSKIRGWGMLYHAYEMTHAAILADARGGADGAGGDAQPAQPDGGDLRVAGGVGGARDVHQRHPALRQAGLRHRRDAGRRRRDAGRRGGGLVARPSATCCTSGASRAAAAARNDPEGADGRADVGALCDAAARHRPRHAARTTTSTSPTGSTPATCRSARASSTSTTIPTT